MIFTPKLSDIPYDVVLMTAGGLALGMLARVNAILAATVLTISRLANTLLFEISDRWVAPFLNEKQNRIEVTPELTYTVTNALISMISIVAAYQLKLISGGIAGCLGFLSGALLTSRLKIIYGS